MAETQYSTLLREVLEASKKIGDKKPFLTSERFLIALIDRIHSDSGSEDSKELTAITESLKERVGDLADARSKLEAYLNRKEAPTGSTYSYMLLILHRAQRMSIGLSTPVIDTVNVLTCMVQQPDEAVKLILKPGATSAATADATKKNNEEERQKQAPEEEKTDISSVVSKVKEIRGALQGKVFGQENAINVFLNGYFRSYMPKKTDPKKKKPQATFLFAGPPGVGKTMLAKQVAETIGRPFTCFDMSGYADKEAYIEFSGSDRAYRNAKPGNVTSFVAKNPKCVLLFDEIEKANLCIIHLFLQILDAGRLRDSYTDQEVSFEEAIVIFTTNAGKQLYESSEGDLSNIPRKVVIDALQKDINPITDAPFFPAAICSRFASGNVVMFNHIGAPELYKIAQNVFREHVAAFEEKNGIRIEIDERVYTALLFSEGSKVDARMVTGRAGSFIHDELFELFRLLSSEKVKTDMDILERIQINVDLSRSGPDIAELFRAEGQTRMLALAAPETIALCGRDCPGLSVSGVQSLQEAIDAVKTQEIDFVLLDLKYAADANTLGSLNMEDVASPARDFFKYLKAYRTDLPVYFLEHSANDFSEEEKVSFMKQGARDVLSLTNGKLSFAQELENIAAMLHQQASMIKLAVENKLVSFETAQTVSEDGKTAEIKLYDFKLSTAVESEDADSVLSSLSRPDVGFEDVIGANDAKRELTSFVQYLRNPKKYLGSGLKAPRGIILYGPPGTGKTMLAKALAHEAGVTFIATEGNQFRRNRYGGSAEEVHKQFRIARKYAPAILFVDEIDTIAKDRKGSASGSSDEEALTAFLTEMDGFGSNTAKPVFVLAATNFDVAPGSPTSLDPALMRRFDRRIYMDLPNKEDRIRYLNKKLSENPVLQISKAQIDNIASRSTGMSLAELESVVDLSLRLAIREDHATVNDALFEEAFETFHSGDAKKRDLSQLERVARHEAGHALLCWLNGETPSYLTIVSRGGHGGYMQHADHEGKAVYTKAELLGRIRTSLGGRAAEIVCYGEQDGISTGAGADLSAATNTAKRIMCSYGMDEGFGLAVVSDAAAESAVLSPEIRAAVNRILSEQMSEAIRLISENREKLDALVKALLEKDHLNELEIREALSHHDP